MNCVLRLSMLAALLLLSACLKKQNLQEETLGPVVTSEQISTALGEGFGSLNYNDIQPGEKSSIVFSQTLQAGTPQAVLQQDITINSINNNASVLALNLTAKTISYEGGGTSEVTATLNKTFSKYSGYAFADDNSDNTLFMFEVLQNLALGSCFNTGNYPETCHNLTSTDLNLKVSPTLAQQHSSCTDINNCYIPAKRVEFDLVRLYQLEEDGQPKRVHYTLILSPEVPFTSRVLRYCTRSLYNIEGSAQKVLADLCYSVNSYKFGN